MGNGNLKAFSRFIVSGDNVRKLAKTLGLPAVLSIAIITLVSLKILSVASSGRHARELHNISQDSCSWLQQEKIKASERQITSQGGQDGIIKYILSHIGAKNSFFVEFGVGYVADASEELFNKKLLNTGQLHKKGWKGVYFDAEIENKELNIVKSVLTQDNIVSKFQENGVPFQVDYVSIDVDSVDLWLFKALIARETSPYRPRLISVEFNINYAPDMMITMVPEWHPWTKRSVYGSSAAALDYIAKINGYETVYIMESGLDMFFVRRDILDGLGCSEGNSTRFQRMAMNIMPKRMHPLCREEDLERIVDLTSFLNTGDRQISNKKARIEVHRLAGESWNSIMCSL